MSVNQWHRRCTKRTADSWAALHASGSKNTASLKTGSSSSSTKGGQAGKQASKPLVPSLERRRQSSDALGLSGDSVSLLAAAAKGRREEVDRSPPKRPCAAPREESLAASSAVSLRQTASRIRNCMRMLVHNGDGGSSSTLVFKIGSLRFQTDP